MDFPLSPEARHEPFRRHPSTAARHPVAAHRRRAAQRGRARAARVRRSSRSMSPTTTSFSPTPGHRRPTTSSRASRRSPCWLSRPGSTRACARAPARPSRSSWVHGRSRRDRGRLLHAGQPGRRATTTPASSPSPAAFLLLGVGAVTLWRSRRRDDALWWRYGRRLLLAVGTALALFVIAQPVALSYIVTHAGKAQVPAANLGAPHENVEFTTSDGLRLKGWYVPSRNGAAVIAFAGRRDTQLRARMLVRHGYGVLLFDRRGEGESEGDPNLFGWQGERDVHARSRVPPAPPRCRSPAHRRHRALGRRRDADRGSGRVARAQGDRHGGRVRPLGARHARQPRAEVGFGHRHGHRHGGHRALHGQPAARDAQEPRPEDREPLRVLHLRREGPARRRSPPTPASTSSPAARRRSGRCRTPST